MNNDDVLSFSTINNNGRKSIEFNISFEFQLYIDIQSTP